MVPPSPPSARLSTVSDHLEKKRTREESPSEQNKAARMSPAQVQDANNLPWDPNCSRFPSIEKLPKIPDAPEGAAWVWGKDDQLGRLNLLTPQRVKKAAAEILTGEMVRLDLPLDVPEKPAFGRQPFEHKISPLAEGVAYDDTYSLNTQSGTQWDGFRHVAHVESKTFYNGAHSKDFTGDNPNLRCSIHHWATHGIAGRGILLDYRHYAQVHNKPFDPYASHSITHAELQACAAFQGLDLRPESQGGDIHIGDILLIRTGFVERYNQLSSPERQALGARSHGDESFAGVAREPGMRDWLHDSYFAAVGGDSPTFEAWPVPKMGDSLHCNLLALWGCPIGEMWDLERLAGLCRARGRWSFFVTSAPANVHGGVGSHANATAIL